MFTVEEVCDEQERQYNQLMQEDDQYCHPESFKWGFEHGLDYALTKVGWHPASELPKLKDDEDDVDFIVILDGYGIRLPFHATYCKYTGWSHDNVKWWSYPPEEK